MSVIPIMVAVVIHAPTIKALTHVLALMDTMWVMMVILVLVST